MIHPLLSLANEEHWRGVIRQTFSIAPLPKKKAISPFYREVESNVLLVGCQSAKAQPQWRLGLRVAISISASPNIYSGLSNQVTVYEKAIALNQPTLVHFPAYQPKPYRINFSVPFWHKQMYVEAWQYSGAESSDIKEMLGQIWTEVQQ